MRRTPSPSMPTIRDGLEVRGTLKLEAVKELVLDSLNSVRLEQTDLSEKTTRQNFSLLH